MKQLHGTGVALVTPFDEKGELDFRGLKSLLGHTAKAVDYFVVMGTTGESITITKEEKKKVLDFVKKNNPKKLPIVYGIGGNNTDSVIESVRETDLSGVDAVLSVSPYYNKPSQEGIYQHFLAVADQCPVPIILYNVPGRTASNISADTTLRLAGHKKIIGVKEASGSLEQCMIIARKAPRDFMLISGDDLLTIPILSIGGVGVISVLANAFPGIFKNMVRSALAENYSIAKKELFKLLDMNGLMYEEGNPTGIKHLLMLMGICTNQTRLPLVPPSPQLKEKIKSVYSQMKKG